MHYSFFSLFRNAMSGHRGWTPTWRDAAPKSAYDAVIVGGGGHGLATAYYLAKEHGLTNIAVLEKGWLGGGNIGRNTTIIRSNYLLPGNIPFYELSMKLWESLEQDAQLQRHGQPARRLEPLPFRRASATPTPGAAMPCDCTASMPNCWIASRCAPWCRSSISTMRAFRSRAGCCSGAAAPPATTRWPGAMRAAPSDRGVDIVQNCEVTGFGIEDGRVIGRRNHARPDPAPKRSVWRRRQFLARRGDGRPAAADRKPCAAGVRIGGHEAADPERHHLRRRPFLHQPVRQGRSGVRRRSSTATIPMPSAAICRRSRMSARAAWR